MKAGSTGRRGNSNSSYILPDPKLNRIVLGKELKAGSSARTSPCPESSTGQPRQRGAPADRPTGRAGRDSPARPPGHGRHSPQGTQTPAGVAGDGAAGGRDPRAGPAPTGRAATPRAGPAPTPAPDRQARPRGR